MHKLHQVMEGIPSVSSAISKCRSDDTTCNHEEMDGAETEGQTSNNVMGDDFVEKSFGIPIKMNILLSDEDFLDDDSSASSDPESVSSSDAEDVAPQRRVPKHRDRRKKTSRKRKESRSKRRSAVYVLIDKVISAQSAANERFSALEERLYK